jgi:hypothetical protein
MKTKEDIAQVLKTIKENDLIARSEIPPVPFGEVPLYQRIRSQAAETADRLKAEYQVYLNSHFGALILKGDRTKQMQFAELAKKVGDTLVFDSNALYEKMTTNPFYMMGGTGNLSPDQIALIFTELRLLSKGELGITRMREPDFNWMFSYSWKTNEALAEGIRRAVFLTNGISLTLASLLKYAIEESLHNPIPRTTIPLVVIGMKDAEDEAFQAFFSHGYIVVDVDALEPTEENVVKAFTQLRDTIRTKTIPKEITNG